MISARIQTGIAAKKSTAECCFMNIVERQTKAEKITTKDLVFHEAEFSLSHTEAMPIEYAQCREGQTPVFVSKV